MTTPLTHATDASGAGPRWLKEALAGCTGALAVLPVVLTLGLLAFSPMGAAAMAVGMLASFVASTIGGGVHATLSGTRLPVSGPTSATALTLAFLVAHLVADPRLAADTVMGLQGVVALCGLAVLLSGAMQIGFALLGMARLARVVPQPVLAGFMNSTAVLIVLSQVPLLFDLPLGTRPSLDNLDVAHPAALLLGLGTAAGIWLLARRWPLLPAALLGLVAGTVAHMLLTHFWDAPSAGARVGDLPMNLPWPPAPLGLLQAAGFELVRAHAGQVLVTALALATIGTLESSLNARATDQLLDTRHDPRRELLALGWANVASGFLGGLPLAVTRARALATLQAGGRGRVAALVGAAAIGLLYVLGGPFLSVLPLSVLAGVMLVVALSLADRWTGRLLARWWAGDRSRDIALSLGVVALVTATTLWKGMAVGIGFGVLLSLVSFAIRMNRSLVHDRYRASERPSRRIYPAPVEARLQPMREGIVVFVIEGPLFFGSGDRLLDEAESLGANCRCLILDLSQVGAIDESGAVALQGLVSQASRRGVRVELSGLDEGTPPMQALRSFAPALPHWPDADRAVEAAELRLLGQGEWQGERQGERESRGDVRAMAEVPLAESSLMAGLDAAQADVVSAHLLPRHLAAGEQLFAQGEPGDRLYVVSQGSISVLSTPNRSGRTQRYLSISPGMMLGETAMLDGGGRTAGAVADAPTVVHALTLEVLDALGRSHPDIAIRLHRNVALHLSQRLRGAAGAWRASAR